MYLAKMVTVEITGHVFFFTVAPLLHTTENNDIKSIHERLN